MHTAHQVAGHVVLISLVLSLLAASIVVAFRLDRGRSGGRLGDPLDAELMRRWDDRPR